MTHSPDPTLLALFEAALRAVQAETCVPPHLPPPPPGRTVVVGAGKAAAAMARAVERRWDGPLSGAVVVPYGHGVSCERVEVIEAAHPVPDEAGEAAARRMLDLATGLGPDDLLLALVSGGGSALLALPAPGVSLADKRAVTGALLRSGAPISAINCVRKHLSAIKGGRLAARARPARLATLVISDVPGDDPATVASGPTLADATTLADAQAVLARYRIAPPDAVRRALEDPANETPKPGAAEGPVHIVARAGDALATACAAARAAGFEPVDLGGGIEGEAREVAAAHAALALRHAALGRAVALVSGGETAVTIADEAGRGGRNSEYALALALALDGRAGIRAIACDTDGIDGDSEAAGAVVGPDTLARARAIGLDAAAMLDGHRSGAFFAALGDAVVTGPTRTNVNDFRCILIAAGPEERTDL
jgi:hydroxypyruvate reductase